MKLSELRRKSKDILRKTNRDVEDSDEIIARALNINRTELFLDCELDDGVVNQILSLINLRATGVPVTKIFKKAYFYGIEFDIDENVLSPRAETEILVDEAIKIIDENKKRLKVLDLCAGSGAIGLSIINMRDVDLTLSDISIKAINIIKKNAHKLGFNIDKTKNNFDSNLDANKTKNNNIINRNKKIKIVQSDMFKNLTEKFDLILSNPPYIETDIIKNLDDEVKYHDPILALDGGADGLKFYREISNNLSYLNDDGTLILEIGYNQAEQLKSIFKDKFRDINIIKDYGGNDRVVILKNKIK